MKRLRWLFLLAPVVLLVITLPFTVPSLTEAFFTSTPTATLTPTPSATPTASSTPTPSATPTQTPSPTPTATPTVTPTPAPTATPTITPSPTPTYPPPPQELRIPILMYHYVSELPPNADAIRRGLTVEPALFEAQLQYLRDRGYQTVFLRDIIETLDTGKPLPEKPIVLTFDDGYKDAYTIVFPLLQEYGFVGEFFVLSTPPHYEAPAYMTWAEMREMAEAGMSIQGHGRDHYDLRNRSVDFLVYQILGIKEAVEAHTERQVTFFCYPSGHYDAQVIKVVASAGYWGAVTTEWGVSLRLDNRYTWPRLRVHGTWSLEQFIRMLQSFE